MARPIDSDALKDVIQQHDYLLADRLNSIDNGMFTIGIFQAIDRMPTLSLDDLRPVGKWLNDVGEYGFPEIPCSVCGYKSGHYGFKYCPSCGSWMKGAEDGTTD